MRSLTLCLAALALVHCGVSASTEGSTAAGESSMSAEEELRLHDCLHKCGALDGGHVPGCNIHQMNHELRLCLSDAGVPIPHPDGGWHGGHHGFPEPDGGHHHGLPEDGGWGHGGWHPWPHHLGGEWHEGHHGGIPLADGGCKDEDHGDGGHWPHPPGGGLHHPDGGVLLDACGPNCDCPGNQHCLNPLHLACPAKFAVCVP